MGHRFQDFWIAVGQPGAYSENMQYDEVFGMNERFGIKIKHAPYSFKPKAKNIIEQNWKDENGVDAWLPMTNNGAAAVTHEALTFNPKFVIFGDANVTDSNKLITQMLEVITGKWLKIWDEYTQKGYEGVYLVDIDDDPRFKRRSYDFVEFGLNFKINGVNIEAPFTGITIE